MFISIQNKTYQQNAMVSSLVCLFRRLGSHNWKIQLKTHSFAPPAFAGFAFIKKCDPHLYNIRYILFK